MGRLIEAMGRVLFEDNFSSGLKNWHHEGIGSVLISKPGNMRLECIGSKQGGAGCMAFCREDFPNEISVDYDLLVEKSNGLVITFVAMRGLNGEDIIKDLPARKGVFMDYVGEDAKMRSYHVSISRYDDDGIHTGVSNWRRNPGIHLMSQGPDLCKEIGKKYHITIVKDKVHCQLGVNGELAHEFIDPRKIENEMPSVGKIGFRAIGSMVLANISHFQVRALR